MSIPIRQPDANQRTSAAMRNATRWFEGAPNPALASMAAEFELKGNRGSARALATKTISIAGLGAIGGETLSALSRAGVGFLQGFDFDRYEAESWLTQPTNPIDAGRLKAEVQGERAVACGSGHILTGATFAQDVPLWLLRKSDVLLAAGDNLEIVQWLGEMAARLGIPLLQGAVHGESWTAFVRSYDLRDTASPCPACAFSQADWLRQKSRTGCDPGRMRAQGEESTRTLTNVCRTAADLLTSETIKVLFDIEGRLVNEELAFCSLSHRAMRTQVELNPDCRCPHKRWNLVDVAQNPADTTPAMLAAELGQRQSLESLQVRSELPWVSYSYCVQCSRKADVRRFGRVGTEVGKCLCGESLRAVPMGIRSVVPSRDLREVADTSLQDLQLPAGAAIGLEHSDGDETPNWFFVGPTPELRTIPLQRPDEEGAGIQLTRSKAK